jgi:hypothetical protein
MKFGEFACGNLATLVIKILRKFNHFQVKQLRTGNIYTLPSYERPLQSNSYVFQGSMLWKIGSKLGIFKIYKTYIYNYYILLNDLTISITEH